VQSWAGAFCGRSCGLRRDRWFAAIAGRPQFPDPAADRAYGRELAGPPRFTDTIRSSATRSGSFFSDTVGGGAGVEDRDHVAAL
jgi:hypothetical protein